MTRSCEHKLVAGQRQTTLCQHRATGANPCRSCPFVSPAVAEGGQKLRNVEHQADAAKPAPHRVKGVGDHLHDIILERFETSVRDGCGCDDMIAKMNQWGPDGCERERGVIVAHLMGQTDMLPVTYRVAMRLPGGRSLARREADKMLSEAIMRSVNHAVV